MKLSLPDIKAGYDRYLLVVVSLLSVGAAVWLTGSATEAREKAKAPTQTGTQEPFTVAPEIETLKSDKADLANRKPWRESKASPFVSRVYLLRDDELVDILEAGSDLFPGISNAWILEHGLDYLDERLPERDPDNDGFTNTEEFAEKTNPLDTTSKPQDWTKLRLIDVAIEQMQFIFTGRDGKNRAMINSIAASSDELTGRPIGPTKAYNVGDTLIVAKYRPGFAVTYEEEKTPFRLADFRTEQRENPRITVDGKPKVDEVTIAVLESTTGDGTKVELVPGSPQTSPYSLASLQDLRPGGSMVQVRTGDSFNLGQSGRYKLVDVSEEKATIEDLGSGAKHVIPKAAAPAPQASPEEKTQPQ